MIENAGEPEALNVYAASFKRIAACLAYPSEIKTLYRLAFIMELKRVYLNLSDLLSGFSIGSELNTWTRIPFFPSSKREYKPLGVN